MPAVTTYSPTGNPYIDGVLGDVKWASGNLTYSFPASGSYYGSNYGSGENVTKFGALSAVQQNAVRSAFEMVAAVANLSFTQVAESALVHGDLRLAMSDKPATAWAYFPSTAAEGGDVWFNHSSGYYSNPAKGTYAAATILHEIGHALGLEHAHEHFVMPLERDSMEYTVMSYRSYVGGSTTSGYTNEAGGYAQSLMLYDIAALQHMYGANFATNGGNTTYAWSATTGEAFINGVGQGAPAANRVFQTLWDGGGIDTYDFANYTTALTISLEPGAWSTTSSAQLAKLHWDGSKTAVGNIANALQYRGDLRSLIENAVGGSAGDSLTGNAAANRLVGNGGNDRLTGHSGNDALDGGAGIDTAAFGAQRSNYRVTQLADGSVEIADLRSGAPDGKDTASNVEWFQFLDKLYSLDELLGTNAIAITTEPTTVVTDVPASPTEPTTLTPGGDPQNLTLTGTRANDSLRGGAGNDSLSAVEGNDVLQGGRGADLLSGGSGIDCASYSAAASGVRVDLSAGAGGAGEAYGDKLYSVENLLGGAYADNLRGSNGANVIKAGAGNDTILGRSGNDVLDGGTGNDALHGQAGRDVLIGGAGADTFVFKSRADSRGSSVDVIRDFRPGVDHIDLRGIDANSHASGNQAFAFLGDREFSGNAGELSFSGGVLSGDVNGDRIADFQIKVAGVSVLARGDFYL